MTPSIFSGSLWISTPLIITCPFEGFSLPFKTFIKVDLPAPDPPIIPTNVPLSSNRLISLNPILPFLNLYSTSRTSKVILVVCVSAKNLLMISL